MNNKFGIDIVKPALLLLLFILCNNRAIFLTKNHREHSSKRPIKNNNSTTVISLNSTNFYDLATNDKLFVDKSLLLEDFILKKKEDAAGNFTVVIARPLGFGKSTNLDMIETFFRLPEVADDVRRNETTDAVAKKRRLFNRLNIGGRPNFIDNHLGRYPVIRLDFDGLSRGDSYLEILESLKQTIGALFDRYDYLLKNLTEETDRDHFNLYRRFNASAEQLIGSLRFLSALLYRRHSEKVILLVDDYDLPENNLYAKTMKKTVSRDYYDYYQQSTPAVNKYLIDEELPSREVYSNNDTEFRRLHHLLEEMFVSAFVDNPSLKRGMLSGTFHVHLLVDGNEQAKLNDWYLKYYGFTEQELRRLSARVSINLDDKFFSAAKHWYGYNLTVDYAIGDPVFNTNTTDSNNTVTTTTNKTNIVKNTTSITKSNNNGLALYNPWSIRHLLANRGKYEDYWVKCEQSRSLDDYLLSLDSVQDEIQRLSDGEIVHQWIKRKFSYDVPTVDMTFLYFAGYVSILWHDRSGLSELAVANLEATNLLKRKVAAWVYGKLNVTSEYFRLLATLLALGEIDNFKAKLCDFVNSSNSSSTLPRLSYEWQLESYYNGIVKCLIYALEEYYVVHANRQIGHNRPRAILTAKPDSRLDNAVIIEYERFDYEEELETALAKSGVALIEDVDIDLMNNRLKRRLRLYFAFHDRTVTVQHHLNTEYYSLKKNIR